MSKNNQAKTYAEQGLEEIQEELSAVPEEAKSAAPAEEGWNEANLQAVSGAENIAAYYQLKTPKNVGKTPVLVFQVGVPIKGTFLRTISREAKTAEGRKFTSYTYLVRSKDDNKIYGLSGSGLAGASKDGTERGFNRLEDGSRVSVTYLGQREGKDGNLYNNFSILGDKLKTN